MSVGRQPESSLSPQPRLSLSALDSLPPLTPSLLLDLNAVPSPELPTFRTRT